jgi:hypothetical protein
MVAAWLTHSGFAAEGAAFEQNGITGADLRDLSQADLLSMDVDAPAPLLLDAIAALLASHCT